MNRERFRQSGNECKPRKNKNKFKKKEIAELPDALVEEK